jgi:hypothetical protein
MINIEEFLEIYRDEYDINLSEGLNKTIGLGQSVSIIKRKFKDAIISIPNKDGNTFIIEIDNPTKKDLEDIKSYVVNNLGWFISRVKITVNDRTTLGNWSDKILDIAEKIESINIYFEAKYDYKIDRNKIPEVLYHITPTKYWNKISKIGLIPKSRSKMTYHPERVYLAKNIEDVEKLGPKFYQYTNERDWTILKINTALIPGEYFQLYQDPNYKPNGYYSMNNIPPIAIEKIKNTEYE